MGQNQAMNIRQWILWKPGAGRRGLLLATAVGLTLLLAWLHYLGGLAYEFHVFFGVPVLLSAWYLGLRPGLGVALFAVGLWFIADLRLGGEQADRFPLLFNSVVRLMLFLGAAWLQAQMRRVLDREMQLAREDTLTGLANRRAFYERGRDALDLSRRQGAAFTAVFIDLDRFKQVNDELGHEVGDALLRRVAGVFGAHVRASDIAGRLGGDEFALLLPGMDAAAALAYVEDLRRRLLDAMRAEGWPVTFSIGVASRRRAPEDFDALLAEADQLMYEVKENGRDHIRQSAPEGEKR
jgi:diguanylate cyclase (GGDEF)-like protein